MSSKTCTTFWSRTNLRFVRHFKVFAALLIIHTDHTCFLRQNLLLPTLCFVWVVIIMFVIERLFLLFCLLLLLRPTIWCQCPTTMLWCWRVDSHSWIRSYFAIGVHIHAVDWYRSCFPISVYCLQTIHMITTIIKKCYVENEMTGTMGSPGNLEYWLLRYVTIIWLITISVIHRFVI